MTITDNSESLPKSTKTESSISKKEYMEQYREKNKDLLSTKFKEYYQKNKDVINEKRRLKYKQRKEQN